MHKKLYIQVFGLALLLSLLLLLLLLTIAPAALAVPPRAPAQPQSEIDACGSIITSTTWAAGNVYTASNCYVSVAAGVTLTIEPGVIVKFGGACPTSGCAEGSVGLQVDGALIVSGTLEQPVVFTSLTDDAHGGDTNGDGASAGAAGQWYGLVFDAGSHGQLAHTWIGYAGSGVFNANLGYGRAQVDARGGDLQLRHTEIISGLRKGIYLEGTGITPIIENVHIADNVSNSGSSGDHGYAIYQSGINMQPSYSNLTFSGNDRDQVTIGNFNEAMTQSVILGGADFGFVCGYSLCQLTVPDGITLTVEPGTWLDFRATYGLAVASGGSLLAEGTATQPITFTSQLAADGDPNQYWMGVWAKQGSILRLDQCDISYADDGNYGLGGLEISTDDAQVSNCHIHHNKQNGLYIYSRDGSTIQPTLTDVDVTDNGKAGVYLDTSSGSLNSVTWDGGSSSDNGYSGVDASNFAGQGVIQLTLQNTTISGNGTASGGDAWNEPGIYAADHNVNLMVENLTISNNIGAAVYWYCNGSITARNLTASGNGLNELTLPGCAVSGGRQWDLGDAGIPARVTGSIEVTSGGLLSILPGTTLLFDKNQFSSPTYLAVQDQAALYALGTAEKPIVLTGNTQEPGWWVGIEAVDRAELVLHHCEIGYGGGNTSASLVIRWGLSGGAPVANIQNCEIHHSGKKGVHFDFNNYQVASPPVFRYNNLHDNTDEAVTNWNAPPLDARDNYWGDPSGPYHATQNPSGLGDTVGDNIIFYPWLSAPSTGAEAPGAMLVSTGAPSLVSPGQTVDYAIQYLNLMTETVQNAILMLQLPKAAEYLDSTEGGIYWPARHQVFWVLGDIAPGDQNYVTARLRYAWGLPRDYRDGSITLFGGTNYNVDALNLSDYTNYDPIVVDSTAAIAQAAFDALRATNPDLETLYQEALGQGYAFVVASQSVFDDGSEITSALLSTADRQTNRILSLYDSKALAITSGADEYTLHDTTGGMTFIPSTNASEYWGNWSPSESAVNALVPNACTPTKCKVHCVGKQVTYKIVTSVLSKGLSWATYGLWPSPDVYDAVKEITKTVIDCKKNCDDDPLVGCCDSEGQVRWSPGRTSITCGKAYCNPSSGTYGLTGDIPCAYGTRCVSGTGGKGGCLACKGGDYLYSVNRVRSAPIPTSLCALAVDDGGDCTDTGMLVAKDPNAIYGPAGDLLPGQTVTYTITYENEGAGRAYGVYVINQLPEVFDTSAITFVHGGGTYLPESRELVWLVGELGPKGAPDSEGAITYTVALTDGLPSGTVVANQAVVYFPSVPEETPTNTWVNLVAPLVATPQSLTTGYMTPLSLTLSGREISGLPLTYTIVEQPRGGILTGTLPNLTYTPVENFVGADGFSFHVSNGITTSRPAQVYISVTPEGDATPPQVVWTSPQTDATVVVSPTTPVFTDTLGPVYAPAILIGVSEPLSETTVATATVTLMRSGGAPITASVRFDGNTYQIILLPRAAIRPGEYAVAVSTGVSDLAGNSLAEEYRWSFSTAATPTLPYHYIYLPLVLRQS